MISLFLSYSAFHHNPMLFVWGHRKGTKRPGNRNRAL